MMYGWVLIMVVGFLAIWYINRNRVDFSAKQAKPLHILKMRYAAGEITRQEYEQGKIELGK